jgi:hypothetical protein
MEYGEILKKNSLVTLRAASIAKLDMVSMKLLYRITSTKDDLILGLSIR